MFATVDLKEKHSAVDLFFASTWGRYWNLHFPRTSLPHLSLSNVFTSPVVVFDLADGAILPFDKRRTFISS